MHSFLSFIHLTIGWIAILAAILLLASSTNSSNNSEANDNHHEKENIEKEGLEVELDDVNRVDSGQKNDEISIKEINNISFSGIDFESILHKGTMIFRFYIAYVNLYL